MERVTFDLGFREKSKRLRMRAGRGELSGRRRKERGGFWRVSLGAHLNDGTESRWQGSGLGPFAPET